MGKLVDIEIVEKVLSGWLSDEFYCTRHWSAWDFGTMTRQDFVPIDVNEIVEDILDEAENG